MASLLLDTHALVFFLERSPELSAAARSAIRSALDNRDRVYVSVVSLVELVYLAEKGRLSTLTRDRIMDILLTRNVGIDVVPFVAPAVAAMAQVPREQVPDMPDRMIAATAIHLGVPLVTRDGDLRASNVQTIW